MTTNTLRPIQQLRVDAAVLHHSIDVLATLRGMPCAQQRDAAADIARMVESLQTDCNRLFASLAEAKA